jgi:hypothetical protein
MTIQIAGLVERYIKLRDLKDKIAKVMKEKLEPVNSKIVEIEAELKEFLDETGQSSAKTEFGTCFKKVSHSVTVENMDEVVEFIKEHIAFDLLDSRVNKTAAMQYLEDGINVPGVKVNSVVVVQVRRG